MKKLIIFLLSGQGSQYYQIGRQLFDEEKTFKKWMLTGGNELVYEVIRIDLIKELYGQYKVSDLFNQTLFNASSLFF